MAANEFVVARSMEFAPDLAVSTPLNAPQSLVTSAESERKGLHARIEEFDLELSISDGLRLPDELIHPRFGNRAVALVIDVYSVSSARRLSIDKHTKSHRCSRRCRSHHEMKIAGVKPVHDPPVGAVQRNG